MNKILFICLCLIANIAIAQDDFVPVEFMGMNAQRSGSNIVFNWKTASEVNNDYFTLQESMDATEWSTITTISGVGTTKFVTNYTFTWYNPNFGYYRLYQTDYDGTSKQLTVIAVESDEVQFVQYYDFNGRSVDPYTQGAKIKIVDNKYTYKTFTF